MSHRHHGDTEDQEEAPTYGPGEEDEEEASLRDFHNTIHIRNLSIKCGHCGEYQVLSGFSRREEWNVYTYECDNDSCDPAMTRTLVEVPAELDEFANRDPNWRGGKIHAGAE